MCQRKIERADSRTRDASRNYSQNRFNHSFFINTPNIWKNLPSVIKDTESLEHFETAIKTYVVGTANFILRM